MGSEESVGSVELKKILESFEAGEVLPEVRNIFSFQLQTALDLIFDLNRQIVPMSSGVFKV